jgi:hypothetical protein
MRPQSVCERGSSGGGAGRAAARRMHSKEIGGGGWNEGASPRVGQAIKAASACREPVNAPVTHHVHAPEPTVPSFPYPSLSTWHESSPGSPISMAVATGVLGVRKNPTVAKGR